MDEQQHQEIVLLQDVVRELVDKIIGWIQTTGRFRKGNIFLRNLPCKVPNVNLYEIILSNEFVRIFHLKFYLILYI